MKRIIVIALALLVVMAATASPLADAKEIQAPKSAAVRRNIQIVAAVRAVLDAQRDAWNRGDIAGYMDGYLHSNDITFLSGDSLTRGWQTVYDRYKKNYDSREKMGTLTFSDLEPRVLSSNMVMMIGRWHLQRANDQPHGRFTLIFLNTKQRWRILHDHTSSAP
jgi:ketosteroid isomerase-like protein